MDSYRVAFGTIGDLPSLVGFVFALKYIVIKNGQSHKLSCFSIYWNKQIMVFTGIAGINNCMVMSFLVNIKWICCSNTWMGQFFMVNYGFLAGLRSGSGVILQRK